MNQIEYNENDYINSILYNITLYFIQSFLVFCLYRIILRRYIGFE